MINAKRCCSTSSHPSHCAYLPNILSIYPKRRLTRHRAVKLELAYCFVEKRLGRKWRCVWKTPNPSDCRCEAPQRRDGRRDLQKQFPLCAHLVSAVPIGTFSGSRPPRGEKWDGVEPVPTRFMWRRCRPFYGLLTSIGSPARPRAVPPDPSSQLKSSAPSPASRRRPFPSESERTPARPPTASRLPSDESNAGLAPVKKCPMNAKCRVERNRFAPEDSFRWKKTDLRGRMYPRVRLLEAGQRLVPSPSGFKHRYEFGGPVRPRVKRVA